MLVFQIFITMLLITNFLAKKENTIKGRDAKIDKLSDAVAGAHEKIKDLNKVIEDLKNGNGPGRVHTWAKEAQTEIMMDYFDRVHTPP
jgi:hypothetical protein